LKKTLVVAPLHLRGRNWFLSQRQKRFFPWNDVTINVTDAHNVHRCAWTGFWIFWTQTPAASNRMGIEVLFAVAGSGLDLDFVLAEKTLLVLCLTCI